MSVVPFRRTSPSALVDRLGAVQSQITRLQEQEAWLKRTMIDLGNDRYYGKNFQAVIARFKRTTLDMTAVRNRLSRQFIKAHSTTRKIVQVTVTPNGEKP
jgi:hypothetical protein